MGCEGRAFFFFMNVERIETMVRELGAHGAPVAELRAWLAASQRTAECRKVTEVDRAWPLVESCSIAEHMANGSRPVLSCALSDGRAYSLSEAQRSVIREEWNMTCSPEVSVVMLATFPGDPKIVREVVLRSEQHVDPQNVRLLNGPRKITIDKWGEFCSKVAAREVERREQGEVDRLASRVAKLLRRAAGYVMEEGKEVYRKEKIVKHNLRSTGIAFEWHAKVQQAEVEAGEKLAPDAVRDLLRELLVSRGEHGLVELVKEPSAFGDRPKAVEDFSEFEKEFQRLQQGGK